MHATRKNYTADGSVRVSVYLDKRDMDALSDTFANIVRGNYGDGSGDNPLNSDLQAVCDILAAMASHGNPDISTEPGE